MTSLGVWACQWRELRPINFGSKPSVKTVNSLTEEDEVGEPRRRGRSRGPDGIGEYEMVGMNEGDNNV